MAAMAVLLVLEELAYVPISALAVPLLSVAGALVVLPPAFVDYGVHCGHILVLVVAIAVPVPIFYAADVSFFCSLASVYIHRNADYVLYHVRVFTLLLELTPEADLFIKGGESAFTMAQSIFELASVGSASDCSLDSVALKQVMMPISG